MRKFQILLCLIFIILTANYQNYAQNGVAVNNNGAAISENEQKALLSERLEKSPIQGTFSSFGNLLFALNDLAIHTDFKEIGGVKLGSPFPDDYKPTWKEVFDTVAIQTQTTWNYDAKRNYWVFTPAQNSSIYSINLANGWTAHNEGIYVGYVPPTFPVGMDIYQLGSYSAEKPKEEAKLLEKVREDLALRFAKGFDPNIKAKDMQTVKVNDTDALYFESAVPKREEIIWRQWVFIKNGKAFAIVSSLMKKDTKLFEDVQTMIKSFQVK
jgi:hypothetical protein